MARPSLATLRWLHVGTDALLVSAGWLGAWALRHALGDALGKPINPFEGYLRALPIIVGPWIATCWWFGIYESPRMRTSALELSKLVRGAALGLLVIGSAGFFFRELSFGRSVVLASLALNLLLQGASRLLFLRAETALRRAGVHDVPVLIVGTGVPAIRLLQKLQDNPETGYRVVGFAVDSEELPEKDVSGHPILGRVDELRALVLRHGVREVFVALPSLSHARMLSLVLECEDLRVEFRCVTNLFEVLTAGTQVDLVDDLPLVRLGRERIHPLYAPAKRAFDVVVSAAALAAAAPLLLWVAWRLRREGVPPLFLQARVGLGGRTFQMWKFRTLEPGSEPYAVAPRDPSDARITRFGRFLRATSIDELPQLWNVLRGEMSLVGPRPEMPFIAATYDDWQRRRLGVKPGITGLWQILGRKDLPMHENLQYDFYYIRNRSLALDLSILVRTVGAVLSRRGAF